MKKIIVANWKMNGSSESTKKWAQDFMLLIPEVPYGVEAVACPPAPLIPLLNYLMDSSEVKLGAQDCHAKPEGAFTGETSAELLKDIGCGYVIVGHSERRTYNSESNEIVSAKASSAIKSGLIPIICIGETKEQRDRGDTIKVINQQIDESLPKEAGIGNFILAYEPVWAIGSGNLPTMDEIKQVHDAIIARVSKSIAIETSKVYVLYGGSVKADNAGEILALSNVSGVLVGGASLNGQDFCKIILSAVS